MARDTGTSTQKVNSNIIGVEHWLDEVVNKKQPLQLPTGARKWIAENSWWLALIGGVLTLWGAWGYWQAGHYLNSLSRWANDVTVMYGGTPTSTDLGPMWYVALLVMVAEGILLLVAVQQLKAQKKTGWNMLFYVSLLGLLMGLLYLFVPGYGLASLIGALIGAAISWFFIFQIRSYFK